MAPNCALPAAREVPVQVTDSLKCGIVPSTDHVTNINL